MAGNSEYIPGVCNIGKAEVQRRKVIGYVALVACLVFWGLCTALKLAPVFRLLIFFPAVFAAVGFLQAWWHFCAKFGFGGVFNFGPSVGKTDTIEQAEYRRKDRRTALTIVALSLAIGVAVAVAAYFLPL